MRFWKQVWEDIRPAARALAGDVAIFLIALGALAVVYLGLRGLGVLGYDPRRLEVFETIHYWAYFVVLAILLIDLILKVGGHVLEPWLKTGRVGNPNED
jgi:hypothetical protein